MTQPCWLRRAVRNRHRHAIEQAPRRWRGGRRGGSGRTRRKILISTQELAIVEAIAERPEIAALIDELYFEYHFYFDGHDFGWGGAVSGDVDTAVSLMHRLRTLGIRAHFWI